ncbi:MAG TPA: sigma-70 family RNA polymerase sigma factor [Labilithrix sp.]|nr:sigma-70 family RNA polymerase sigma factor [Labilithrix sp.]
MSAAYDSLSLSCATAIVELDEVPRVPEPPASGVKSVIVPVAARSSPSVVDRDRAFHALYTTHSAFVWRNLRRLGVADADVEDKLQEVFVVAHRRWSEFVDRGHGPRAWLFQIALRVASDTRRHRRRHPVDPDGGAAQERQSIEPPQAAELDRRQQLDLLDRALSSIDMGRRAVLVLYEIEQMTAPEIARTLDIPLNTVYSRLRVARTELEQALRQLGGGT